MVSPPPPYSPRRDEMVANSSQPTTNIASPADTVSPDSEPSRYNTPVSAATTISPDFAPRHQNGRSPLQHAQPSFTESPVTASKSIYPPPPAAGISATSRVRSASKNHTDRLISSLTSRGKAAHTSTPGLAIDTLQHNTAQAIANAPTAPQEDPALRAPASRRAASTGAIGLGGGTPRTASRSPSQSRWEPGMPLPPPPPGPPPSSTRSQSLNRPSGTFSNTGDSAAPRLPRTRLAPGNGTSLGPVPPTPADWREDEPSVHQTIWPHRSNGPLPLHIDTGSILQKGRAAASDDPLTISSTPVSMRASQVGHTRRDSSNGTLFRSPAVRNRSAKGIRERRSESRNGKDRATDPSSAASARNSGQWASVVEDVRPTDLILPASGLTTRCRASTIQTPRSGKSIRSLDEALSNTEMRLDSSSGARHRSNDISTALEPARSKHYTRAVDTASPLSANVPESPFPRRESDDLHLSEGIDCTERQLAPKQRTASEERPISHLLHMPNCDDTMQAPLVPLSPYHQPAQYDLLGPESPTAFAQRANDRHRRFAEREANATTDSERLDLFVEYTIAESRIRRDQYAAVFDQEQINVEELAQGLFARSRSIPNGESNPIVPVNGGTRVNMSKHTSTASESSAQGSQWHAGSVAGSRKHESPLTVSSDTSPQIRPDSTWWKDYIPSLSPIASMSIVTGQDDMDSRGRAPSRWFEGGSVDSCHGEAFRVLGRSKRESKYMGVPREARHAPSYVGDRTVIPSIRSYHRVDVPNEQKAYGDDEYPPEKVGWHEKGIAAPTPPRHQPLTPQSAPYTPDARKLDISRLVTLPPPYPRHHPAVNNSHPDLATERSIVTALHDMSEPESIREAFKSKMAGKRQRGESWCKHQRSLHEQDIQFRIEHGEMSQEDFDKAEADINNKVFQSEKETVQADFDLFQDMVVSPLHALFTDRINKATSSLDVLSNRLFSDAQQHSPNLPQEEGDEHAELLEKLTQLKWLFEARETLHRETYQLLNERNDKYKAAVLLPYQQNQSHDKLTEAESFFFKDSHDRKMAYEQAVASRCEAFLAVIENNVVRGVEIQLSAFWDIAPSILQILQKLPPRLDAFEIQIPAEEFEENPSYHEHPLQYLYSLVSHAEKSTHQFIESQINLLCLLHEIRSLALNARFRIEENSVDGGDWASHMATCKLDEEKALMDDLQEKVGVVEGQWVEGLGSRIRGDRERIRDWLVKTGGWDEDAEWE